MGYAKGIFGRRKFGPLELRALADRLAGGGKSGREEQRVLLVYGTRYAEETDASCFDRVDDLADPLARIDIDCPQPDGSACSVKLTVPDDESLVLLVQHDDGGRALAILEDVRSALKLSTTVPAAFIDPLALSPAFLLAHPTHTRTPAA
jgi:hypothetical protein